MPLRDVQTALGLLVTDQSLRLGPDAWATLSLTPDEQRWLADLAGSPGLALTRTIGRWWREMKVRMAAPLTVALLTRSRRADLVQAYLDTSACASLFFVPEAVGFLDFVLRVAAEVPHLPPVAGFERALLLARDAGPRPPVPIRRLEPSRHVARHPAAAVVAFEADPARLLHALLADGPLPEPDEMPRFLLVAPGAERFWRCATRSERALFVRCAREQSVASLVHDDPALLATLTGLVHVRALEIV